SNIFLIIFAAGMVTSGVHEFTEAGIIPGIINPLWDLGSNLSDSSQLGLLLQSLVGYHSAPTLAEIIAYVLYLGGIGMFTMTKKEINEPLISQAGS
ncbi:MAG: FTR1 family protein, partial [Chloroflexota bacterium]